MLSQSLVLMAVICAAPPAVAQTRQDLWDRCKDHDAQDLDLGIGACTALIQSGAENDANLSALFVNRGLFFTLTGQPERALKDYETAIRLDASNATAYYDRGLYYLERGDFDRATADADRAMQLRAGYVLPYAVRGEILRRRGRYAEAVPEFDRALSAPVESRRLERNLRNLRATSEQATRCGDATPDVSIGACTAIVQDTAITATARAAAFNRRGVAYSRLEDRQRALADYGEAIKLDASVATYFSNRGLVGVWLGAYEQCAKDFERALAINPKYAPAINGQGLLARQRGEYPRAIALFTTALAALASPDSPNAASYRSNRGIAYLLMDKLDDALSDLNAAISLDPKSAHALFARGVVKRRQGNVAAGDADLSAARAVEPRIESIMAVRKVKP